MKIGATRWWANERALSRAFCTEDSVLPSMVASVERIANNTDLPPKTRAKAEGDLLGVFFRHIFSLAEPVSVYLQSKEMDHVQASRLASDLISNMSKLNVDSIIEEAKYVASSVNAVLDTLDGRSDVTNHIGLTKSRLEIECPAARRVPVRPQRLGERASKFNFCIFKFCIIIDFHQS